jgi:hypothetical protein
LQVFNDPMKFGPNYKLYIKKQGQIYTGGELTKFELSG